MKEKLFQKYAGSEITESILQEAAELFSQHYGVWGPRAAKELGAFAKEGSRVKVSKDRLRAQCLPAGALNSYVRVTVDGHLVGHAFACRWVYEGKAVCWITQLVVHQGYRERELARALLNELREGDAVYGIMSSHAAACMAAARAFGNSVQAVELDFIKEHAEGIMRASPVSYVRDAELHGRLFGKDEGDGAISCADTRFFVDHTEPLQALASAREAVDWPLGELIEGHEFLMIVKARRPSRFMF